MNLFRYVLELNKLVPDPAVPFLISENCLVLKFETLISKSLLKI